MTMSGIASMARNKRVTVAFLFLVLLMATRVGVVVYANRVPITFDGTVPDDMRAPLAQIAVGRFSAPRTHESIFGRLKQVFFIEGLPAKSSVNVWMEENQYVMVETYDEDPGVVFHRRSLHVSRELVVLTDESERVAYWRTPPSLLRSLGRVVRDALNH